MTRVMLASMWRPMETPPGKSGRYLTYAPSADPNLPLRQFCYYDKDKDQWSGLVTYWMRALTHWMPYLIDPPKEAKSLKELHPEKYPKPEPIVSIPPNPDGKPPSFAELMEVIGGVVEKGYIPGSPKELYYVIETKKEDEDART